MRLPLSFVVAVVLVAGCGESQRPAGDGDGGEHDATVDGALADASVDAESVADAQTDAPSDAAAPTDAGDASVLCANGCDDGIACTLDRCDADTGLCVHVTGVEVCDERDNDCDGFVDEELPTAAWYRDEDADGFGDSASVATLSCAVLAGHVANALDCDDAHASVYSGRPETCDAVDNDCDGLVDDGVTVTAYVDADHDGYGAGTAIALCTAVHGYATASGDCNDSNALLHPNRAESCDELDNDCDTEIDEGITCIEPCAAAVGTTCDAMAECEVVQGVAQCACPSGYEDGDATPGHVCNDINECTRGTHTCAITGLNGEWAATCTNTAGSFTCACNGTYVGDGHVCNATCDNANLVFGCMQRDMRCVNELDGGRCTCRVGYEGAPQDGNICIDINECERETDQCSPNATCTNSTGNYACGCHYGFEGDGRTCSDINECMRNTDNCDAHAYCNNTVGSFTCECHAGYSGNGVYCIADN